MKLKILAALAISGTLAANGAANAQSDNYSNDGNQRIAPDTTAIMFTPKTAPSQQCLVVEYYNDLSNPVCWDKKLPAKPLSPPKDDGYSNDGSQKIGPYTTAIIFTPQIAPYKQCAVIKHYTDIGSPSCWDKKAPSP